MTEWIDPGSPLGKGLTKLQNLVLLNIAFVFTCIPLVTAGAAFAALHDALRSSAYGSQGMTVLETYWISMKTHFKSAAAIWIPIMLLSLLLAVDLILISGIKGYIRYIGLGFFLFVGFLIAAIITTAFPLLTCQPERGMRLVRFSLGLSSASIGKVIPAVLLKSLPVLGLVLFPAVFVKLFMLWGLIYFALAERINVLLLGNVLQP